MKPRPGPCGCTADTFCEQHWQALSRAERRVLRHARPTPPGDVSSTTIDSPDFAGAANVLLACLRGENPQIPTDRLATTTAGLIWMALELGLTGRGPDELAEQLLTWRASADLHATNSPGRDRGPDPQQPKE